MKFVVLLAVAVVAVSSHKIEIYNNCGFTVWPGVLNNPNKPLPQEGGFQLDSKKSQSFEVEDKWAGRFWGRTGCNDQGKCDTGDCGNKIKCAGAGGTPPVTLAEITFDGDGGQDYYDVSLVDGYNLQISMEPIEGTFSKNGDSKYDCGRAGCTADLNTKCPSELAVQINGNTAGCKSACEQFNTDQYCCRGDQYGTPDKCKTSEWPVNYAATFKESCPDAYSYAYDDKTSTFICRGNPKTGYKITFCP